MKITRRDFLKNATLAATSIAGITSAKKKRVLAAPIIITRERTEVPFRNILFIMCDQWRARQHWPRLRINLPNFNALRGRGIEFTNCFTASAACCPSRACIFTSKYSTQTGVTRTSGPDWSGLPAGAEGTALSPDIPSLGQVFREAGYDCQYRGKWHISDVENDPNGLTNYGFDGWVPPDGGHEAEPQDYGLSCDGHQAIEAANFIRSANKSQPWLLVASLINPHDICNFRWWPYPVPDMGVKLPPNFRDSLAGKPSCQRVYRRLFNAAIGLSGIRGWKEYVQTYAHLTQIADFQIGVILDALRKSDQFDNTLIVMTSDHGEMGGSHRMIQKFHQAYEETIRVPLIFSNPRMFRMPRRNDSLVSTLDIFPTLLSLAGISGDPYDLKGTDISPILRGKRDSVQDSVLFITDDEPTELMPGGGRIEIPQPNHIRTIRTRRWKYSRYFDPNDPGLLEYELYDLENDPGELRNLAYRLRPEYRRKVEEMEMLLRAAEEQKL